ncbi:MAG: alpha/beta hydrolase [Actinomycetota bacterium]|nr:alpha/beta hydrolase [Actinomycetota bacterium]
MRPSQAHATRVQGSGNQTYILGHGLGGTQAHWEVVAEHLQQRARVITFDLAGSGACDPSVYSPIRHASILGFADDLAQICTDLEVRGATFIGHSMSGMAGALAAAADPGLFSKLVMVGSSARYLDDPATGYIGGFSRVGLDEMLASIEADFMMWSAGFAPYVMGHAERPELANEFTQSLRQYPPDVAYTILNAAFSSDFRSYMPLVLPPTLVLQGTDDPAVPLVAAMWLADAIPHGELELLDIVGHFPHVVDPESVIAAMEPFLERAPG